MIPRFRAWYKKRNVMSKIIFINFVSKIIGLQSIMKMADGTPCIVTEDVSLDEVELLQWSGLQVQGQDLYVNDIVEKTWTTSSGIEKEIGVIQFGEHETSDDYYASGAFGFFIKFVISPFNSTMDALPTNDIKILGNIYENPGLLEQK